MDDRAEPNDQSRMHRGRVGRTSARTWRAPLTIGVAVVVGLALGVGVGAATWGGAPASGAAGLTRTLTSASASALASGSGSGSASGGSNLYAVDARSGTATRTGPNSWRLTLTGTSVLWFKDRPFRGSGTESAATFVSGWSRNFAGSPPYGAVLAPAGPPGHHPTAVKLTDPTYDPATGATSVTLTPDKGESDADAAWLSKLTPGAAATDGRVILFVDNSSPSSSGPLSADDENIIEYFNQIEFSEDIAIIAVDQGTQYNLQLSCPPRESANVPSPNFLLTMYTANSSSSMTCNEGAIVLPKAGMPQSPFCSAGGSLCSFDIVLSNLSTGTIYCSTEVMITFTPGMNATIIPNLNPATLPISDETTSGSSTPSTGNIDLCESSVSCTDPSPSPTSPTYSYNSNVYFQTGVAAG